MSSPRKQTEEALSSWTALNTQLLLMKEHELAALLKEERAGKRRESFMLRIYGRFSTVRAERERALILGPGVTPTGSTHQGAWPWPTATSMK